MPSQGELAHCHIKSLYALTNKNNAVRQITKQEARWRHFKHPDSGGKEVVSGDLLPPCDPELHHFLSDAHRNPLDIFSFLREYEGDPPVKVLLFYLTFFAADYLQSFIPKLKDHLLYRLLFLNFEGEDHTFTDNQRCKDVKSAEEG